MTFDPYRTPPADGRPVAPVRRGPDGALITIGLLSVVMLLSELGILAYDISQQGPGYLPTALGLSFDHYVQEAPVGFFGYDSALTVALVVLAVAAFTGRRWVRPAAVALFAVDGYSAGAFLIYELTNEFTAGRFAEPFSSLMLNLTRVLAVVLALVVAVVVLATRPRGPVPGAAGPQQNPYLGYPQPAPFPAQPGGPGQPFGSAPPYTPAPSFAAPPQYTGAPPFPPAQPYTPAPPGAPPATPPADRPEDRHQG
ncbi:hypothetical protein OG689_30135 [Kitasatospora sp. NBC_00240]|uniref:hypothetical protein n=1 Tax=Kitasatospora sp. NBC_00240 TaxID=2903567 RepID=UPI00225068B8|nr:hypothetical protein [Kitasatospora sp. NBC_00240]MCX5213477.1 hypothetical protein [Kitasatospora sp. NBC_00240]